MGYTTGCIMIPVRGRVHVYIVHRALRTGKIILQTYHAWYRSEEAAYNAICALKD